MRSIVKENHIGSAVSDILSYTLKQTNRILLLYKDDLTNLKISDIHLQKHFEFQNF